MTMTHQARRALLRGYIARVNELEAALVRVEAETQERDSLRQQIVYLRGYAQHRRNCHLAGLIWTSEKSPKCTCGLAALLTPPGDEKSS